MMMARNAGIDMAKFVFCLVIVFYHFFGGGVFPGGYTVLNSSCCAPGCISSVPLNINRKRPVRI